MSKYKTTFFSKSASANPEVITKFLSNILKVTHKCEELIPKFDYSDMSEAVAYERLDLLEELVGGYDTEFTQDFKASASSNYIGVDRPLVKILAGTIKFEDLYDRAYRYQNNYIPLEQREVTGIAILLKAIIADFAYGVRESFRFNEEASVDRVFEQACLDSGYSAEEEKDRLLALCIKYPTNLPVLEEHPELLQALASAIPEVYLSIIVDNGETLTVEEVTAVINGTLSPEDLSAALESRNSAELSIG